MNAVLRDCIIPALVSILVLAYVLSLGVKITYESKEVVYAACCENNPCSDTFLAYEVNRSEGEMPLCCSTLSEYCYNGNWSFLETLS